MNKHFIQSILLLSWYFGAANSYNIGVDPKVTWVQFLVWAGLTVLAGFYYHKSLKE